jgi:hypothetical protein
VKDKDELTTKLNVIKELCGRNRIGDYRDYLGSLNKKRLPFSVTVECERLLKQLEKNYTKAIKSERKRFLTFSNRFNKIYNNIRDLIEQ